MASLLFNKADKVKQRLHKSFSCSSAASTSVAAFSSNQHSPHLRRHLMAVPSSVPKLNNNSSSSSPSGSTELKKKKKKKKKTTMSPVNSSRFLLNSSRLQPEESDDVNILDSLSAPSFIDLFPITNQQIVAKDKDDDNQQQQEEEEDIIIKRSCSTTSRSSQHQVVVLKVSLHCKGCAGKVKKHIAKMEGVTSFDIDIATKKVTVMGDVTPLGVLNCISKVKSAQFWPSASSLPRASTSF